MADDEIMKYVNPLNLKGSVGPDKANDEMDLRKVRYLLEKSGHTYLTRPEIAQRQVSLFVAIELYQLRLGLPATGSIEPWDETHKALIRHYNALQMGQRIQGASIVFPKISQEERKAFADKWRRWEARAKEKGWKGYYPGIDLDWHRNRNEGMICPNGESDVKGNPNWIPEGNAKYHCDYSTYRGRPGTKYEGFQCSFDERGDLVLHNDCKGTYDYFTPYDENGNVDAGVIGHGVADFFAYLLFGN